MVDRKSIANDLNAIANGVTREDGLIGVLDEIGVVCENINELIAEEAKNVDKKASGEKGSEKDQNGGPCSG